MTGSQYRPAWALTSAAFGYAMALISLAPVSIAFPALVSAFGVEVSHVGWVSTSYLLSLTILALLAGRLGDLYGHRRIFVIGVVVSTVNFAPARRAARTTSSPCRLDRCTT